MAQLTWRAQLTGVAMAAAVAAAVAAAPAAAAPYTEEPEVGLSIETPVIGATIGVSLAGFGPFELVRIELHSKVHVLKTVQMNRGGAHKTRVKLPPNVRCRHEIVAVGINSGRVTASDIMIGADQCGESDRNVVPAEELVGSLPVASGDRRDEVALGAGTAAVLLVGAAAPLALRARRRPGRS